MNSQTAKFIERVNCINCDSSNLETLSRGLFQNDPLCSFIENDPWGESPIPYIKGEEWVYVRCMDCNQMFHKRVLSPEWNEKRFSEWMSLEAIREFGEKNHRADYDFIKAKENVSHILRIKRMTSDLRGNNPVRLLDFGCGWGSFLTMCDSFGFEGYGIDRSSARRDGAMYNKIFHEIDDLMQLPEAKSGFHVLTLFEVLEHLDEPLAMLRALSKFLVPGGLLILETPDCTGVKDITSISDYRKIHPLDHINAFTPETLCSIADRAGYDPVVSPSVHVTSHVARIVKNEMKHLFRSVIRRTTQQYFIKNREMA